MIRVLIVDDEKIVRKGIISVMPWEKLNMRVIGEAANGKKALKFMEEHSVDLLITDITMPVMSGIELMEVVKEKYPNTAIVVLTCHQDFDYIQQVLRIGAIDYIIKTQLEDEVGEKILTRILGNMDISNNKKIRINNEKLTNRHHYSESIVESIENAIKYIEDNICKKITQSMVAKEVNVSRSYFSKCFKDLLGISFSDYVREKKIKKAGEYLLNTSKPVYWIAQRVGFDDEKYFSRVFKEFTGFLPTEYRKKK